MEHKLINTRDYLLIVDESEIKEGDLWYNASIARIWKVSADNVAMYNQPSNMNRTGLNKIIAHLPLGSPILEGVDLLPPLEDDIKQLGIDRAIERKWNPNSLETKRVANEIITAVEYGYNKAKEKYKYTEEDIAKAIDYGFDSGRDRELPSTFEFIQSLQQPKMPVGFECEMVDFEVDMGLGEECIEYSQYPKTTTNSQGITQWIGEYIY
jgi:hypothetical protein